MWAGCSAALRSWKCAAEGSGFSFRSVPQPLQVLIFIPSFETIPSPNRHYIRREALSVCLPSRVSSSILELDDVGAILSPPMTGLFRNRLVAKTS